MSARHPRPALPGDQLTIAWQSASLLLGYPDEQLLGHADLVRTATAALPARLADPLRRFLDHLERTPLAQLAEDYVDTFDHRRRCCLFLTYFAYGDTRRRGMALLRFTQAYRRAGLRLGPEELPDELAVVLEFAATADRDAGWALLLEHRAGLEVLRLALGDAGSPWADVVEAVCATLPPLRGEDREAVARLVAEGPAEEEVGLTPYALPEYSPATRRGAGMTSGLDTVLWVVFPYVCLTVFVVGHVWRYRYDKFGWTTRSSQLYENRLLRLGSPLFHFGILIVLVGHVMGLGVPKSWTEAVGISDEAYHAMAVGLGTVAGVCTVAGLTILIYRRRTVGPVFSATTRMDKAMYAVLATVIVLGLVNTAIANLVGGHYDYREGVSVWFRGIFRFSVHPELIADAPLGFQLHGLAAFALFALWPFTRLVHVFSAPLGYLTRPYIVYRSRDERLGTRAPRRGWERVG